MNRELTELAELELDSSGAWCDLHAECFRDIFAPGSGVSFTAAKAAYEAWCRRRELWASAGILRRQLAKAGYEVRDETILGVQLNALAAGPSGRELNISRASQLVGVRCGLLRTLREYRVGPPSCGSFYPEAELEEWRQTLLHRERKVGWEHGAERVASDLFRCLESICEFSVIERKHTDYSETERKYTYHPRLTEVGRDRVAEEDLFDAVRAWYLREIGQLPWSLLEGLKVLLGSTPLDCRRARRSLNGKRYWQWSGVWLRSALSSEEAEVAARLREKSGLHITVPSLFCDAEEREA